MARFHSKKFNGLFGFTKLGPLSYFLYLNRILDLVRFCIHSDSLFTLKILLQVFAFVAPKIIGGRNAPSPVGELGMVEMSQALDLIDVRYEQVSGDPRYFFFSYGLLQSI